MEAVRPADTRDHLVLAELVAEAIAHTTSRRGGQALLADITRTFELPANTTVASAMTGIVASAESVVLVGTLDEVVLSYLLARQNHDGLTIAAVFVTPGARGVGLGASLIDAAIAGARSRGSKWIDALARPGDAGTKQLFESHGLKARQLILRRELSE